MRPPVFWSSVAALVIIVSGCSGAPTAAAQPSHEDSTWYRASIDSNLSFWFVDAASIHEVNGSRRAWIAYKVGVKQDRSGLGGADLSKSLMEFDCAERRFRVLSFRIYDRDDIQLNNVDLAGSFNYIMPGTPHSKLLSVVCSESSNWPADVEQIEGDDLRGYYSNWIGQTISAE